MKTKGITIWEKHAEKIVVAIAAAAAIAFTALQFIGEPNAVTSGSERIAPSRIDEVLESKARAILAKLGDEAPPGVEFPDPVGAADELAEAIREPVGPRGPLSRWSVAIAPNVEGLPGGGVDVEFPVPSLKAPYELATGQTFDALDPAAVDQVKELKPFFPDPAQPYDVIYVTAVAHYSLADLRAQFHGKTGAESSGAVAIPSSWYNDRPENIVDVVVERQELIGGTWSDGKAIDSLPGRFSFRAQLAGKPDASLRDTVLAELEKPAVRTDIIQPSFYATRNEAWELPVADDGAGGQPGVENDRVATLRKRLKDLNDKLEELMKRLEALGGRMDDQGGKAPPGGGAPGGPGGGGGAGAGGGDAGGGGKKPPPGSGGPRSAPGKGEGTGGFGMEGGSEMGKRQGGETRGVDTRAITNLKNKITRLREEIAATEAELKKLLPGNAPAPNPNEPAAEPDEVLIWAHDMTVEPGHTYRYRFTVSVYNPFFGRKRSLIAAQEHLAESFVINSKPSDWSAPMRVDPPLRVFITSAAPAGMALGAFSLGQVRAEVYRFYDGTHWMEPFTVEPGQQLGATIARKRGDGNPVDIDFSTGLFVLDIVEDIGSEGTKSARVLLQDARTGEILEMRDPDAEMRHPERRRLQERVEAG